MGGPGGPGPHGGPVPTGVQNTGFKMEDSMEIGGRSTAWT